MSGNTLQQVKFKYLRVVFTSDGRQNRENGKANAVIRGLHSYVVTKQELSNTAKLSVFKSVSVQILTYGYESWAMTQIILSQVLAADMMFLLRVQGVTPRDKLRSYKSRKALNVEPLLRIERSQLSWFGRVSRISQENWRDRSYRLNTGK